LAADLLTIDNLVDDLETRLTAVRAGYLDELDFDLDARLGAPAGASMSVDIAAIKAEIDHGTYGLAAIETLVDENESLLKNATYGLSALKTKIDDLDSDLVTHDTDIKGLLTTVQTDLDNPNQYKADVSALALEATLGTHDSDIKGLLVTVQADLDNPAQYKADVSALALEATLGTHDTDIKALINALNDLAQSDILDDATPFSGADIALIKTETDKIPTLLTESQSHPTLAEIEGSAVLALKAHLVNGTGDIIPPNDKGIWDYLPNLDAAITSRAPSGEYDVQLDANISTRAPASEYDVEMARITANVATEAKQDIIDTNVDDIETDTADMQPRIPRIVCHMDFWSLPLQVTITATAGDRGLVDVVVSGLPAGVTIIAVQGMFLCDSIENSFDGVNYLESTKIQVKEKTAGTDRDAITLEANKIFRFADDMIRGGTVLVADWATAVAAGILAEVVGNDTYQMWFDVGESAQNNIVLDGAQFGLRIWFSV